MSTGGREKAGRGRGIVVWSFVGLSEVILQTVKKSSGYTHRKEDCGEELC